MIRNSLSSHRRTRAKSFSVKSWCGSSKAGAAWRGICRSTTSFAYWTNITLEEGRLLANHELIQLIGRIRLQKLSHPFYIFHETGLHRPSGDDLEPVLGQFAPLLPVGRRQRRDVQVNTGLPCHPVLYH